MEFSLKIGLLSLFFVFIFPFFCKVILRWKWKLSNNRGVLEDSLRRQWAAFLGAWCPLLAIRSSFVNFVHRSVVLSMNLYKRKWSPRPIPRPSWLLPPLRSSFSGLFLYSGSFVFPFQTNFRIICSSFVKNTIVILIGIARNL